jgi:hypothetical protein
VVICEDEWLSQLANPTENLQQHVAAATRIRKVVASLSIDLPRVPVDFAAKSMEDLASQLGV